MSPLFLAEYMKMQATLKVRFHSSLNAYGENLGRLGLR